MSCNTSHVSMCTDDAIDRSDSKSRTTGECRVLTLSERRCEVWNGLENVRLGGDVWYYGIWPFSGSMVFLKVTRNNMWSDVAVCYKNSPDPTMQVLLGVAGTHTIADCLTDCLCDSSPFQVGFAHRGAARASAWLCEEYGESLKYLEEGHHQTLCCVGLGMLHTLL